MKTIEYKSGFIPSKEDIENLFSDVEDSKRPPQTVAMFSKAEKIITCYSGKRLVAVIHGDSAGTTINLAWIYVNTSLRRNGIGQNLVRRFVASFPHCTKVKLITHEGAFPFFEKLGFATRKEAIPMIAEISRISELGALPNQGSR